MKLRLVFLLACLAAGCNSTEPPRVATPDAAAPLFAHLEGGEEDSRALERIRAEFRRRNPGYDLRYENPLQSLKGDHGKNLAIFVQSGKAIARAGNAASEIGVGEVMLLRKNEDLQIEGKAGGLIFDLPVSPPEGLPSIIRPDWDPKITDVLGGCATETGAYRRILLTWEPRNGPYVFHAINAHRVRMMDSLTHYHPVEDGFDEFYLVQMALPGARVLTSRFVDKLTAPETVTESDLGNLLEARPLKVGDIVYLPRGIVHRGLGGVLAQVITVPGFKPGAQFGVDHHILAINRRLGLTGDRALPFNVEVSAQAGQ